MELEIEVLWHTDSTQRLENADVDFNVDELQHRTMIFYNIDAISPLHWDDEHEFCNIHVGGEKWISPYIYEIVKQLIRDAKDKTNNQ